MSEQKEVFDEYLCEVHDKLAANIKQHYSAGEPTKESGMAIALQYLNSGMLKASVYWRSKLDAVVKERDTLRENLLNKVDSELYQLCKKLEKENEEMRDEHWLKQKEKDAEIQRLKVLLENGLSKVDMEGCLGGGWVNDFILWARETKLEIRGTNE